MPIKPSIRPESYSALVIRSLKVYREVLPSCFLLGLLISIIVFMPRLICVAVGQNVFLGATRFNEVLVMYLAMYVSMLWFMAAIIWCINCIERKKHKNFIIDIEMAGRRILHVLGAALILFGISFLIGLVTYCLHALFWHLDLYSYNKYVTALALMVALSFQCGFSVFVAALFYFYFPLIVIEQENVLTALRQSALLVWHHVQKTLMVQLTPWLTYFVVLILVKNIFNLSIHIYFEPVNPVANFNSTLVHIFILALFIPWVGSTMLVQLRDLELRKATVKRKR